MPFVKISLAKKLAQEAKDNISHSIHKALVQEFNIPIDDYFHVIEELESSQIKFPKSYLGISHTENLVFIQIIAGQGRTFKQKERLYFQIAEHITKTTEILKGDIIITLLENNGPEDWSFGNGEIQTISHLNPKG